MTHDCPGRCGAQVPQHYFACRKCWFRLPRELRYAITRAYRVDPVAHRQAMAAATDWFKS